MAASHRACGFEVPEAKIWQGGERVHQNKYRVQSEQMQRRSKGNITIEMILVVRKNVKRDWDPRYFQEISEGPKARRALGTQNWKKIFGKDI